MDLFEEMIYCTYSEKKVSVNYCMSKCDKLYDCDNNWCDNHKCNNCENKENGICKME